MQPDTIIPDLSNPQNWNRYSYVRNRPLNLNDPSGHRETSVCSELAGGCDTNDKKRDEDAGKLVTLEKDAAKRKCEAGDPNYCPGYLNNTSRPISGYHTGISFTMDLGYGNYQYEQTDYLFDWTTGTFYVTRTTGSGTYVGAPSGAEVEKYWGLTNVYGIPMSDTPEQVANKLEGSNVDYAYDVSAEVFPPYELTYGDGLSVDLDPTGNPVVTSAGPMFTTEKKVGVSGSVLPFPGEVGLQKGSSNTSVVDTFQLPWWPF